MRLSLAVLLLLLACRASGPKALEDESVRLELGRRVVTTLDQQEHYFQHSVTRDAFVRRLESIAHDTGDATGYYRLLADALASLDEGHTGLVGSASIPFTNTIPPVALLDLAEGPVVAGVAPGIESGGLQPGDLLLRIGGRETREILAEQIPRTSGSTAHGRRANAV